MAQRDGTGPSGQGSLSGRGMGQCVEALPGFFGFGRGRGQGQRQGRVGRGFRWFCRRLGMNRA